MIRGARTLSCFVVACLWLLAVPAAADGPYEGTWREGPMRIQVTVQSWGGDCGPRPQSTSTQGGGTFSISQAGDQLTFNLRTTRTTRTCWSENRAVRRVSSSYQAGTWRIVCRTPQADSRAETGTYTIQAVGDDRLQFRDQSQYDWQLNESRCQASIVTTQTFTRVGGGGSAQPTPPTEPAEPRCTPGAPARVVLRPSRAEVQPGGEQCFTARVVDGAGCTVRRRASLRVASGGGSVDGLCYTAGDAPGAVQLVASAGDLRAEANVVVRTMDLSDLIARRSESGSVGSGAPEDASSQTAARLTTNEEARETDLTVPLAVLAVALLLVVIAVVALRRRRPKRGIAGLPEASMPSSPPPAAGAEPAAKPAKPARAPGDEMICPTCRRGYGQGERRCPHDDTELVRYRDFAAGKDATGAVRENVCPVCGDRFPESVRFCGKDGVALEPAPDR